MPPSPLYLKLLSLTKAHAFPKDASQILSIRSPDAHHAWGHNFLVARNRGLQDYMDNDVFATHMKRSGLYLDSSDAKTHDLVVDEHERKSTIRMSYFLTPKGSNETVEHDLIWMLKFTDDEEVEKVLIKESVEFIDAAAGARMGKLIREHVGELEVDMTGSIVLKEALEA
ncbi:hypothetical protein E1B28_004949 [Marasmius oreades]|uniref:Uncharacterized protein n=1 Tax=Marasmius oreades TaxID=181124 RepID=A0A9P7UZL2_9AGAR|nr:uncharacterized protein E1B28_004949 [Marasmius oreades]KAG7097615.1 hypothetical protein E1B28_004949 [Marasmius oreades]